MIVAKLMGGLGNQMFQYAAAKSLSLRHRTALKLDLSSFERHHPGNTPRTFALDCFSIDAPKASRLETVLLTGKGASILESAVARCFQKFNRYAGYREKQFHVDPAFFSLPDNVHLEGYWQSERYFVDFEETIRKDFTIKTPMSGKNLEIAGEILSENAVSVHVRRGDFVMDEKIKAKHDVCRPAYYQRAEEIVVQAVGNPHFFVFSDDPVWVAANVKMGCPVTYVSHNGGMPQEDLRLMSLCKHHVIANSSFSWWGAWLSSQVEKMVIAPDKWFNDPSIHTDDLIPPQWKRI